MRKILFTTIAGLSLLTQSGCISPFPRETIFISPLPRPANVESKYDSSNSPDKSLYISEGPKPSRPSPTAIAYVKPNPFYKSA
jgi:hypothetical protein